MTNKYSLTIFYLIVASFLVAILFTNPFLKYPYDIYQHLIEIDKYYESTTIPAGREVWHFLWGNFFYFFGIEKSNIFYRGYIIYYIQTFIAVFSVYYFSKVIFRNLFKDINEISVKYMSFWSVIIWFSIFATFSMNSQLVWNQWYSVNYQITLPLFWYILALSLIIVLEKQNLYWKFLYLLQIILLSIFIIVVHAMEYIYFIMHIVVLWVIFLNKKNLKKNIVMALSFFLILIVMFSFFLDESLKFDKYFSSIDKLQYMFREINFFGKRLLEGLNRSQYSINELMYIVFILSTFMLGHLILSKNKNKNINIRMLLFVFITSLFVIIPLYKNSAGIFAVITNVYVVNRLYYSSSLFILIPIIVYYFIFKQKIIYSFSNKLLFMNLIILLTLVCTYKFSKYSDIKNHNYYKNIQSIKNSFYERRVGFSLDSKQIKQVGEILESYEVKYDKNILYFARTDIAFVIKYVYRKNVYQEDRGANPDHIKIYQNKLNNDTGEVKLVLFETPKNFPNYLPYN